MFRRWVLIALLFAAAATVPSSARAASVEIGLSADYWTVQAGVFAVDIEVKTHLTGPLLVGGRFGGALIVSPVKAGMPLDLVLTVLITHQVYLDLMGGPWLIFGTDPVVRGHFAAGFGFRTGRIRFGPEIGYLSPEALLGVRLAFSL